MSVERAGFQIDMTADASGVVTGAKQASAALGETADATKDLDGKLKDAGHAGEEGAEGFKVFGSGAHEAHAALRVLNDAVPGFEQMSRFLANGLTATMGVGALVFGMVKKNIEDTMTALDALQASPGARGEWLDHLKELAEESAVSFGVFEDHIQKLMRAQQSIQQLTERGIAQDRERISSAAEIGKAQDELAQARLALAEKLGQITPQQAIKIRLEIDEAAFKREAEIKLQEIQAELTARTQEQRQNGLDRPRVIGEVDSTKAAADAAAAAAKKNDDKIAQDNKNLADSIERQKKAQEIVDSLAGKGTWGGAYDKTDPQYYALKAAQETVESEARQQSGLKQSIGQEQGKKTGLDTAAETSKSAFEDAKARYEQAVKDFNDAQHKIDALTQDLQAEKAKVATLESLHNQTAETTASGSQAPALHTEAANAVTNANKVIASFSGTSTGSNVSTLLVKLTAALSQMTAIQADFQKDHVEDVSGLANKIQEVQRDISQLKMIGRVNRN